MNLSINEKFRGMLFGYAVGDALGLGTEFMTRAEIRRRYPEGLQDYSQIVRDAHRSQWHKGEWTNDTEIILPLVESMTEKDGFDLVDYAHRLKKWYLTGPIDLTVSLRANLSQPDFASNPLEASRRLWATKGRLEATSECLGRSMFAAIWKENAEKNVLNACRMMQPHSICETVSLVFARMVRSLFWEGCEAPFDELVDIAKSNNKDVVKYLTLAKNGSLSDIELDNEESWWYARKAMCAALWTLWHCDSFEKGVKAIVAQGGDANTNASITGGLLGIKYGYSAIPDHWIVPLEGKDRLNKVSDDFVKALESRFAI